MQTMTSNTNKLPSTVEEKIHVIQNDNTHGSVTLTKWAIRTIQEFTKKASSLSKEDLLSQLITLIQKLIDAQPAMGAIFNLGNHLIQQLHPQMQHADILTTTQQYLYTYQQSLEQSDTAIVKQAIHLLQPNTTILTHSYSSTVEKTLVHASKNDKNIAVICTESQPKKEGVLLAKKLAKHQIHTTLIVDSAITTILSKTDYVLVGADLITGEAVVNKSGTSLLSLAARHKSIPMYILSSTHKIVPASYRPDIWQEKNPEEIFSEDLLRLTPLNYYFDQTDLCCIKGVVTEEGVFSSSDIQKKSESLSCHPSLLHQRKQKQ